MWEIKVPDYVLSRVFMFCFIAIKTMMLNYIGQCNLGHQYFILTIYIHLDKNY